MFFTEKFERKKANSELQRKVNTLKNMNNIRGKNMDMGKKCIHWKTAYSA